MNEIRILGLLITDRIKESGQTQQVLSRHARLIRSRLGFHELSADKCSRTGMILLQLTGRPDEWDILENELKTIEGLEIQIMKFTV